MSAGGNVRSSGSDRGKLLEEKVHIVHSGLISVSELSSKPSNASAASTSTSPARRANFGTLSVFFSERSSEPSTTSAASLSLRGKEWWLSPVDHSERSSKPSKVSASATSSGSLSVSECSSKSSKATAASSISAEKNGGGHRSSPECAEEEEAIEYDPDDITAALEGVYIEKKSSEPPRGGYAAWTPPRKRKMNNYDLEKLSNDFEKLFLSVESCDVHFVIGKDVVPAHKCILIARVPYFRKMFWPGNTGATTNTITLDDTDTESFKEVLRYIYCGKVSSELEGMIKEMCPLMLLPVNESPDVLLPMAEKYGLQGLKDRCAKEMRVRINGDNMIDTLVTAEIYHMTSLRTECLKRLSKRPHTNVDEFFSKMRQNESSPVRTRRDMLKFLSSVEKGTRNS